MPATTDLICDSFVYVVGSRSETRAARIGADHCPRLNLQLLFSLPRAIRHSVYCSTWNEIHEWELISKTSENERERRVLTLVGQNDDCRSCRQPCIWPVRICRALPVQKEVDSIFFFSGKRNDYCGQQVRRLPTYPPLCLHGGTHIGAIYAHSVLARLSGYTALLRDFCIWG